MKLANKVSLITGAGSGIGQSSAYLYAIEGAKVVVADKNDTAGMETVNNIKTKGGEAIFVHTDISKASEAENAVKATLKKFGKIDILFNNAGVFMKYLPIEEIEESYWDYIFSINIKGMFLMSKNVVPEMKKAGHGVIINTASMLGLRPGTLVSAYASSKGAVITFTKELALELAPHKIRVNCICPMLTDTPMIRDVPEERKRKVKSTIPLGRLATAQEMAFAALYLASEDSSILTGVILNVDGGTGI